MPSFSTHGSSIPRFYSFHSNHLSQLYDHQFLPLHPFLSIPSFSPHWSSIPPFPSIFIYTIFLTSLIINYSHFHPFWSKPSFSPHWSSIPPFPSINDEPSSRDADTWQHCRLWSSEKRRYSARQKACRQLSADGEKKREKKKKTKGKKNKVNKP